MIEKKTKPPTKTDGMRWLDERSMAEVPERFLPLLKGYKGTKVGMQLRALHLGEFTQWYEQEFKPKIYHTLPQ